MEHREFQAKALITTTDVLKGLVERGCLSDEHFSLVLRAAKHAEDPQFALGFAVVVTHHDPRKIPISRTVELLIEQQRRFSLRWPPPRWKRKLDQLERARSFTPLPAFGTKRTPCPARYTNRAGWLDRCLPQENQRQRISVLDTRSRLFREAFRQGIALGQLDTRLRRGHLAGLSVLVARERWTVTLHAPMGRARPRLHRVAGARGTPPDELMAEIKQTLGDAFDMTPVSRRRLLAVGRIVGAGLGLLYELLIAQAPIYPLAIAPSPPVSEICACGIGLYAIRQALPETSRWLRRLSAVVFGTVWLPVAIPAALAVHGFVPLTLDEWHAAQWFCRQLLTMQAGYLLAALAWSPASRWWHTRPRR